MIAEVGPVGPAHPPTDDPPRLPAALHGLGLDSFGTWDDDVLVVPAAPTVAVRITDQTLSLFVGLSCWGSCDLPADPAWHLIDSCPVGVMPYASERDSHDPAVRFVGLLREQRAVIADAAVLRRHPQRPHTAG